MIAIYRCPVCDHEGRVHGETGCFKCACVASPLNIVERRLQLMEIDLSATMTLVADLKFRLERMEKIHPRL